MHRTENEVYPIVSLIYGGVPIAKSSPYGPLPPGSMLAYMAKFPTPLKIFLFNIQTKKYSFHLICQFLSFF